MKAILKNLALIHLMEYCRNNGIPCNGYQEEGTHLEQAKGYSYNLVSDTTGKPLLTVTFSKSSIPTFIIHKRQ